MKQIKVLVGWSDRNYSAVCDSVNGVVIDTHKELETLKRSFAETFAFHVKSSVESGDTIDEEIVAGDYELVFELQTSALLHSFDGVLTRSALARLTGINERQLGHYASGLRTPRPKQRERIIEGIHRLGNALLSVC